MTAKQIYNFCIYVTLRKLPNGHPIVFPVNKWLSSRADHSLTVEARRSHVGIIDFMGYFVLKNLSRKKSEN